MNDEFEVLSELSRTFLDCSEAIKGNSSFKQTERAITFNGIPVFSFFGDKGVIMAQQPRERFKVADHVTFDDLLDFLRDKDYAITRVVRMSDFYNADKQLEKMISSPKDKNKELVDAFGLDISNDDLETIAKLKTIKGKFKRIFTLDACASDSNYTFAENKSPEVFLLDDKRITLQGGGWNVTTNKMKKTFDKVKPFWQGDITDKPKSETYNRGGWTNERIHYYDDKITFDRVELMRSEVERMALHYGWLK